MSTTLLFLLVGFPSAWAQPPNNIAHVPPPALDVTSTSPEGQARFLYIHPFWDRENLSLHGANLLAQTLDHWTTRRLVERDYREVNPLVRPFVGSDAAMAAHKFGLSFGGALATSYWLHRKGHHRWERLTTLSVLGTTAPAVGLNYRFVF